MGRAASGKGRGAPSPNAPDVDRSNAGCARNAAFAVLLCHADVAQCRAEGGAKGSAGEARPPSTPNEAAYTLQSVLMGVIMRELDSLKPGLPIVDAGADARFRSAALRVGLNPDDLWVGHYVDFE